MVHSFPLDASFLSGKSVLLTGGTGFVGKCILELILRDHYPHVNKIYLLIRGKKDMDVKQRVIQEILSNKLFNVLKDKLTIKQFYNLILPKLIPIQGDISMDKLGISEADLNLLKSNLNIIIHCAATVDFNERLDRSLKLNTLGTLQLIELADQCPYFDGFVHVSTAYVNSNRKEKKIYERVYPMIFGEVKDLINQIQNMDLDEITKFTEKILSCYPNTYTFTKSLAENMILIKAEEMRLRELKDGRKAFGLAIVRPTVVTSTAYDPIPGWVDGVAAANAIAMYIGLGILDSTPGPKDSVLDLVPVDYLAKIVLKACQEFKPPGTQFNLSYADPTHKIKDLTTSLFIEEEEIVYPKIYHASSSGLNPITWLDFGNLVVQSWLKLPPLKKRVFPPSFHKYNTDLEHDAMLYVKQQYKFTTLAMLANINDPERAKKLSGLKPKLDFLYHCFKHFMVNTWFFQNQQLKILEKQQTNQIKTILSKDISTNHLSQLNWKDYIMNFIYGMYYFVLNDDPTMRKDYLLEGWGDLKYLNLNNNNNINNNINNDNNNDNNNNEDMADDGVLNNKDLMILDKNQLIDIRHKVIHDPNLVKELDKQFGKDKVQYQNIILKELLSIEKSIQPEVLIKNVNQLLQHQTILINKSKMIKLKDMLHRDTNTKVIYLPNHASILDFNLITFLCYHYELPIPLLCIEPNLKIIFYKIKQQILFNKVLFKHFNTHPKLLEILIETYCKQLLLSNHSLCLFLNNVNKDHYINMDFTKLLNQDILNLEEYNDLFINLINDIQLNNQNIILIPISINYEKQYDLNNVINQLTQQNNNNNSLINFNSKNNKILVTFGNPIFLDNLKHQIEQLKQLDLNDLSLNHPSYMMASWQCQNQLISPINCCALILSSYRTDKGISFINCQNLMVKLKNELINLGFNIDWNENEDSSCILSYCLERLGSNHVTVTLGDQDEDILLLEDSNQPVKVNRIYLNNNLDTCVYLNLLTQPIIPIFLFDGLWILSYYFSMNLKAKDTQFMGLLTLVELQDNYEKILMYVINLFPEIAMFLKQKDFKFITQRFIKMGMIQVMEDMIIMDISPCYCDYLHLTLSLLHPKLDTLWCVISSLSILNQIDKMKLTDYLNLMHQFILDGITNHYLHYFESLQNNFILQSIHIAKYFELIDIVIEEDVQFIMKHSNLKDKDTFLEHVFIKADFIEQLTNLSNQRHQLPKPLVKFNSIPEETTLNDTPSTNSLSQNLIHLFQSSISKISYSLHNNNHLIPPVQWSKSFFPPSKNTFPISHSRKNSLV